MVKMFRLMQLADSTLPTGAFSFSNGLETAAHLGIVHDAETLAAFARSIARQAAFTDGVCALLAFRALQNDDYEALLDADRELILLKMNDEARLMLTRMGKKLAELGVSLLPPGNLFNKWLEDIKAGITPGVYPVAQAIAFAIEKLDERELFACHQYGVINMVLSAALRCVRVSHYDTQKILYDMAFHVDRDYEEARTMNFENMNSFVPQCDIFASLHEKGAMRMFMN